MDKLRVLLLSANPLQTDGGKLQEEINDILTTVMESQGEDVLEFQSAWIVREEDLRQVLAEYSPQIVHFSCRGSSCPGVMAVDRQGSSQPIKPDAVSHLFGELKTTVRMVVLNRCFSKAQAKAITQDIDCAVGIKAELDPGEAVLFASALYEGLANGFSVRESFERGLGTLLSKGVPVQDEPELLTNPEVGPGQLFLMPKREVTELLTTRVLAQTAVGQALDGNRTAKKLLALMTIDTVNSCQLLAELGEKVYAPRKNRLMSWLRDVIQGKKFGGREVKEMGDGMLAIFPSAANAVECALTIQESLPAGFFSIRVGLDMGVIELVFIDGKLRDMNGFAVNRLCRIEPLGEAGHVLVSRTVWDTANHWLTGQRIKWKDHGRYRLKGISDPERVYEPYFSENKPLLRLKLDRLRPDQEIVRCSRCDREVELKDTRTCPICNTSHICFPQCFDQQLDQCVECTPVVCPQEDEETGPAYNLQLWTDIEGFRRQLLLLDGDKLDEDDWILKFETASSALLSLLERHPKDYDMIAESVTAFQDRSRSAVSKIRQGFRPIIKDRLRRIQMKVDEMPKGLDTLERSLPKASLEKRAEELYSGLEDLSAQMGVDSLLSQDELAVAEGIHWFLGAGVDQTKEFIIQVNRLGRLDEVFGVIWKHFPRVFLYYDNKVFKEISTQMNSRNSKLWGPRIREVLTVLKPGVPRDEAEDTLSKLDESNRQVVASFLAVCPNEKCRELGLDRLSLENRWDILLSLKVPIQFVRELVEKSVKEALENVSVENGMGDYMKTMLLVLRERLIGVDSPFQIQEAYRILKSIYAYPAFLEESFFEILVQLHGALKSKAQENPETLLLEKSMDEEFKNLISKEKFPDADIALMSHVPLAVQRKLARDGVFPEIFICNLRDPIALETIPHVEKRPDIETFFRMQRINKKALSELAKNEKVVRIPSVVPLYCAHSKAEPQFLSKFVPRLSKPQWKALAANRNATPAAREMANRLLKGGGRV